MGVIRHDFASLRLMPPKKRTAVAAELPLNERARRAMTALVGGLGETLALMDAVGAAQPLPVSSALVDDAMRLLARASGVVCEARFARIEEAWLPDDIMRLIMSYACGHRHLASQFGTGGVRIDAPAENPFKRDLLSRHNVPIGTLRLVCKSWARLAGGVVLRLDPTARPTVTNADVLFGLFPNASIIRFQKWPAATWKQVERLIQMYVAKRAPADFFVDTHGVSIIPIKTPGAVLAAGYDRHGDICKKLSAKYKVCVLPQDRSYENPVCVACCCDNATVEQALSTKYHVDISHCSLVKKTACSVSQGQFKAPVVYMTPASLTPLLDAFPAMFDAANWANDTLPAFHITAGEFYADPDKRSIHKLVQLIGDKHIVFRVMGRLEVTLDQWVAAYPAS